MVFSVPFELKCAGIEVLNKGRFANLVEKYVAFNGQWEPLLYYLQIKWLTHSLYFKF